MCRGEFPKGKLLASQPFIVELEVEKENCVAECRVNLALLSHYDSPFNAQNHYAYFVITCLHPEQAQHLLFNCVEQKSLWQCTDKVILCKSSGEL